MPLQALARPSRVSAVPAGPRRCWPARTPAKPLTGVGAWPPKLHTKAGANASVAEQVDMLCRAGATAPEAAAVYRFDLVQCPESGAVGARMGRRDAGLAGATMLV
jgi:hypothetical protein